MVLAAAHPPALLRPGADPRAGGAVPCQTPCHADPECWHIVNRGPAAVAAIRSAVAGCARCRRTHPDSYDACENATYQERAPLSVMAGAVITEGRRNRVAPEVYIRRHLTPRQGPPRPGRGA